MTINATSWAAFALLAGPWIAYAAATVLIGWCAAWLPCADAPDATVDTGPMSPAAAVNPATALPYKQLPPSLAAGARQDVGAAVLPPEAPPEAVAEQPQTDEPLTCLLTRIVDAERTGRHSVLGRLYLSVAMREREAGAPDRAAEALRRAIRFASAHGQTDVHAAARLELGDIAEQGGDLTTACEHWQLARNLFHGLGQSQRVEEADKRMLSRGCPTDWVLNDF